MYIGNDEAVLVPSGKPLKRIPVPHSTLLALSLDALPHYLHLLPDGPFSR